MYNKIEFKMHIVPSWVHIAMPKPLQSFVQELVSVQDEKELRLRFMDAADELFHVQHWGFLFDTEKLKEGASISKAYPIILLTTTALLASRSIRSGTT